MSRYLNTAFLFIILSSLCLSTTQADVVVYTERSEWEAAVLAVPIGHFHDLSFEEVPTGGLVTGDNYFFADGGSAFPLLTVGIPGTPGYNAIDDSVTNDPFMNALSPNGSTYYLGDVGVSASEAPILSFIDYLPMFWGVGFGADWVVEGDLLMEVQDITIDFNEYLPSGSGFLGVLGERRAVFVTNLSGSAVFGMDNIQTGNTSPEPTSIVLLGMVAAGFVVRRRR